MALKKSVTTIPLAAMDRILKKAGADRVSDTAKKALCAVLEEVGIDIGRKSMQLSQHAGRKTIKEKDIILASKK